MHVDYCDLCDTPLKPEDFTQLYMTKTNTKIEFDNMKEYYDYLNKEQKKIKIICPTCEIIINQIFTLRRANLTKLSLELLGIYTLSSKIEDKKNGKEKK